MVCREEVINIADYIDLKQKRRETSFMSDGLQGHGWVQIEQSEKLNREI
jgi:hypothetical protein